MYDYYIVKEGDTIDKIASNYNTTNKDIVDINNLKPTYVLEEGTKIKVPVSTTNAFNYYTVIKGDTIYSIARKYNISPQNLILLNNLNQNSFLYPNQKLLVPNPGVVTYITKMGDSIDTLTQKSNQSYDELLLYNNRLYLLPDQLIVYKVSE